MSKPPGSFANMPEPPEERLLTPMDLHLGNRARLARLQRRMTQEAMAEKLGVRRMSLRKYEDGQIRLSGARLYDIGRILNVEPAWFYKEFVAGEVPTGSIDTLDASRWSAQTMAMLEAFHELSLVEQKALVTVAEAMVNGREKPEA